MRALWGLWGSAASKDQRVNLLPSQRLNCIALRCSEEQDAQPSSQPADGSGYAPVPSYTPQPWAGYNSGGAGYDRSGSGYGSGSNYGGGRYGDSNGYDSGGGGSDYRSGDDGGGSYGR